MPKSLVHQTEYRDSMKVSKAMLAAARTVKGGYTRKQIALAQSWFPGKWKKQLLSSSISSAQWKEFVDAGSKYSSLNQSKKKSKIINSVSKPDQWSWQPKDTDIPKAKTKSKKNRGKNKARKQKISKLDNQEFYVSREWRSLRIRVLEKYECKCMMCGRSPKLHKIVIHVDHIKPRSKYPELSLDFNNLQLLCEDCNLGKSNKYETDWRPDIEGEELDNQHLQSISHLTG